MIRIESDPWQAMAAHAEAAYPNECCGALLGGSDEEGRLVSQAVHLANAFDGSQRRRYEIRPQDLLAAEAEAESRGLQLVGIYHSHPDEDAYFSETDLKHSCPWYSFVVLSVRGGRVGDVKCYQPDEDQTSAREEALQIKKT